jgi:glycosyltransferase involved in cell wall biosynthesis
VPSDDPHATATNSSAPIRIARIITRLNVGGPAIQAIEMSARLESTGYHTLLVHGRLGPGEGDMSYLVPSPRSFEMAYVPELQREPSPFADAVAVAKVLRLLRTFRPAIVHTHMAKAGTVGRTAASIYNATVGRRARARLVHTYHGHVLDGYFSPRTAAIFTAIERALGRRTDAVIAVSPSVLHDLRDRHRIADADRFRVVPLGFDLSRFAAITTVDGVAARRALALDADAHVTAFVGRLTAIKQPELFVDAAQRIAHVDDRARFLVAGGGELESSVRAAVSARGLADRVRFLGWQRHLENVYAASDLVVVTSRNEGTPVALIEGMAAGVPGVCFDVGGVRDVIAAPDLGILVPAGDVNALAGAMRELFDDGRRREAMGARARESVVARYGVDRLVHDLDGLYRELLSVH